MIRKVLLPDRGEIAARVLRSLHEAGLQGIVVCSDAGGDHLHVRLASASYAIGPAPAVESYLRFDRICRVTRRSGAGAIHLGHGKPRVRGSMRADLVAEGGSQRRVTRRSARHPRPARDVLAGRNRS
ncbi:biotin carboxylase N-terminal domain-containing protein [Sorangium sp. So ce426]|uniref:biotin carboxylase N-terminal domain-containing protein n=1 Tax=Sorangium sp. So ce426 TaxID=3133312 RepID=UPI003F5B3A70